MKDRKSERCLWLTEEEALGLLDIAVMSLGEMTPDQRMAVAKLSEFCRQCLRDTGEITPPSARPVGETVCAASCAA